LIDKSITLSPSLITTPPTKSLSISVSILTVVLYLSADWKGVLEAGVSVANDATMRAFVASPNPTKANKAKTMIAIFTSALGRALSKQEKIYSAEQSQKLH
jgi:hypothetical protein